MHRNDSVESQIRLYTDHVERPIEVDLDKILIKQSHKNQSRGTTKVDEDHVLRMASSAEMGVVLPPIVLNRVGEQFAIIDGIHRVEERKLRDKQTIMAYVVEVDSDLYDIMCLGANAGNGKPLTDQMRTVNALAQIAKGLPTATAAKVWGIHPERLGRLRRAAEGRKRAAEAGLPTSGLSEKVSELLQRLEVDQIRSLGLEATKATIKEIEEAVQAISAAPAAERAAESIRQAIVLETKRQQREAPKARNRNALSSAQLRTRAREILLAIRTNRAHLNDKDLVRLLDEIQEVTHGAARSAA